MPFINFLKGLILPAICAALVFCFYKFVKKKKPKIISFTVVWLLLYIVLFLLRMLPAFIYGQVPVSAFLKYRFMLSILFDIVILYIVYSAYLVIAKIKAKKE